MKAMESFMMKGYILIGGRHSFVDVEVVPEQEFARHLGIGSREEYAAVVQYLLHYDSRIIEMVCQTNLGMTMPVNLVFGPISRERGAVLIDLAPASAQRRYWCLSPCGGSGARCHVALPGHRPGGSS
jgi:hypothetical protein